LSKSTQLDQQLIDACALVHSVWNDLTRTWTLPTIHALGLKEPARFNELKRRINGISATSLAERLSKLEKEGIVQRSVYPDSPPRVEYSLTEKGHELHRILEELADWVKKWAAAPQAGREEAEVTVVSPSLKR
jgi:DNA-binding HxlR family transcriptional regulator